MGILTGERELHKHGLFFGKFYPLHHGHLELVEFAQDKCTKLTICICCSNKEEISTEVRKSWLEKTFAENDSIHIEVLEYDESVLENTSVSSKAVSKQWSQVFKSKYPETDCLFSGEPYGDYVSEYMDIKHFYFPSENRGNRTSATMHRENLLQHWHHLAPSVQAYFQKTVAICGTESTGKSTLSTKLLEHYEATLVEEVGRDLIPSSNNYIAKDLHKVADAHANNIKKAKQDHKPFVLLDTDVYITQSYANFKFGEYLQLDKSIYHQSNVTLRLYLNNDIEHIQDATRLNESERNILDQSHRQTLEHFNMPFIEIIGSYAERYSSSIKHIDDLFNIKWRIT